MSADALTPLERALVAALTAAIVKELRTAEKQQNPASTVMAFLTPGAA